MLNFSNPIFYVVDSLWWLFIYLFIFPRKLLEESGVIFSFAIFTKNINYTPILRN